MIKKDDNYDKRIIIATILSTLLIVVWARYSGSKFFSKNNLDKTYDKIEQNNGLKSIDDKNAEINKNSQKINVNSNLKEKEILISNNSEKDLVSNNVDKKISIETNNVEGTLNLRGLILDDFILKKYNKIDSQEKFHILNSKDKDDAYYITFGWDSTDDKIELPNQNTLWQASSDKLSVNNPITLYYTNNQNIKFSLVISIDENYMLTFNQNVINNSNNIVNISINNKIFRKNSPMLTQTSAIHEGFVGVSKNRLEEIKYKKLEKSKNGLTDYFNWAGLTDKYWLVSFANDATKNKEITEFSSGFDNNNYYVNFFNKSKTLNPNDESSFSGLLFVGAKELTVLDNYATQYNLILFDRSVDFGWFYFLTKPIYVILRIFYNFVGNFGIAILILTFIVKFIMFPFTRKSYVSMAKLKIIQPKVDNLKERYAADKSLLGVKLMELYKKEEISPLSGCFPMLVQIPVFFSLYKVLSISIDMRQAPFFGYIKNLADKDPTTLWNLFGLLPYKVSFLQIGLLPCLMSLTMWIQQSMTSSGGSTPETQATIKYMPIIFLFLFAGMPSGLLIYWTFSNIITIFQQYYIEKKLKK